MIFSIKIISTNNYQLSSIITFAFLISIIGTIDDRIELNPGAKLALQIIPILYLIISNNLFLINLGNYNFFELNFELFDY